MRWLAVAMALLLVPGPAWAQLKPCPAAEHLPQLTIDNIRDPAVPVEDRWQVFWDHVPISDAQLAMLARVDPLIDRTREEMEARGTWVYLGLATTAVGTAASSVGWLLYGQGDRNDVPGGVRLSLGFGGLVVGLLGLLLITESIQVPLEPHLAPTPRHRLSREEVRSLVAMVNLRLYQEICEAADVAAEPE